MSRSGSVHIETFRWRRELADRIAEDVVASAREALAPAQFSLEFEGDFASMGDERVIERPWIDAASAGRSTRAPIRPTRA